jgi:hypothetical protein
MAHGPGFRRADQACFGGDARWRAAGFFARVAPESCIATNAESGPSLNALAIPPRLMVPGRG